MRKFGLIGTHLSHSFSPKYFSEKFYREEIDAVYDAYEIKTLDSLSAIKKAGVEGLNVTMPFKKDVITFLDEIDKDAAQLGAVNTIKFEHDLVKGYNTDVIGFQKSLIAAEGYEGMNGKALILGTGGASLAVAHVLKSLGFSYHFISRTEGDFTYEELSAEIFRQSKLIVNTTPLGSGTYINECPDLHYDFLTKDHLLYDLVYNPEKTLFLTKGIERGAFAKGGKDMLIIQAEAAWDIWNYLD